MSLEVLLKTFFGELNILEIVAIIIVAIVITMVLLTTSIITKIISIIGIIVIIFVLIFSTVLVKGTYFLFKDSINRNVEKGLTKNLLREDKKTITKSTLDYGRNITNYSLNKPLGRNKYSEFEVKNSLDKIYSNYGLDTIFYIQDVLFNARKLEGSSEAIYISLEDYAFICSMNICNKYLYDFNDVKRNQGGPYLVVIVPEFLSTLENYVP